MLKLAFLIVAAILFLLAALEVPSFPRFPVNWGWLAAFFVVLTLLPIP